MDRADHAVRRLCAKAGHRIGSALLGEAASIAQISLAQRAQTPAKEQQRARKQGHTDQEQCE